MQHMTVTIPQTVNPFDLKAIIHDGTVQGQLRLNTLVRQQLHSWCMRYHTPNDAHNTSLNPSNSNTSLNPSDKYSILKENHHTNKDANDVATGRSMELPKYNFSTSSVTQAADITPSTVNTCIHILSSLPPLQFLQSPEAWHDQGVVEAKSHAWVNAMSVVATILRILSPHRHLHTVPHTDLISIYDWLYFGKWFADYYVAHMSVWPAYIRPYQKAFITTYIPWYRQYTQQIFEITMTTCFPLFAPSLMYHFHALGFEVAHLQHQILLTNMANQQIRANANTSTNFQQVLPLIPSTPKSGKTLARPGTIMHHATHHRIKIHRLSRLIR
jgi:hypothetical protein